MLNETCENVTMVYGAIDQKSEVGYTCLLSLFEAIENEQLNYNWLITDFEGYPEDEQVADMLNQEYCWLTGEQLTEIVEKENFQWIWGILSGFEKEIPLSEVLKYSLPETEIAAHWKKPVFIQHKLSSVEILAFDSCLTVFKSKNKELVDKFKAYYKESEDLEEYI